MRTASMRSFDEPCGSWQVAQFSRTGACSHSIGPRISVWQLMQLSATELPTLSALTLLIEPCGLWHVAHAILPSRTGMCATARSVLATCTRWHVAHSSVAVAATSWLFGDFGLCTLWQVVHDRLRDSCVLPVPAGVRPAVVARRARLADLRRLHRGDLLDVPLRLRLGVHVRLPGPVAALAAEGRGGGARIGRPGRAPSP